MSKVSYDVFNVVAVEEGKEVFEIKSARSVSISYAQGRVFVDIEDALFNEELFEAVMNGEYYGRWLQCTLKTILANGETQKYEPYEFELKDAEIIGMNLNTEIYNTLEDKKAFPVHITLRAHVGY